MSRSSVSFFVPVVPLYLLKICYSQDEIVCGLYDTGVYVGMVVFDSPLGSEDISGPRLTLGVSDGGPITVFFGLSLTPKSRWSYIDSGGGSSTAVTSKGTGQ